MKIKIWITVAFLMILSACNVSKIEITTPMNAFPSHYRLANISKDSLRADQLDWKSFFHDKQLIQLIERALVKNSDMLIAIQNIEIATLNLKKVSRGHRPKLHLEASSSIEHQSDNNLFKIPNKSHVEEFKIDFLMSWEVDIWGKIKNQKTIALASYLQSEESKNAVQTTLIAQIAQIYYNLLILDNQLALAYKNTAISNRTTEVIQLQFNAGKTTSLAVEQAKAQHLNFKKLIPNITMQILIQENSLSVLTGTFPNSIQRQQLLNSTGINKDIHTGIPAILLSQRPDVKRAELDLKIANAEVGIAQAAFYPSFSLTASEGLHAFKVSNWFNIPASLFGLVAGNISQPITQRRMVKTNYQQSLAAREKVVINFRAVVLNAVREVSDALAQIERQNQQQVILNEERYVLKNSIDKAQILFKSGRADYLEILIAQTNLLNYDMETTISKRNQLFAYIALYRSLGGGWH